MYAEIGAQIPCKQRMLFGGIVADQQDGGRGHGLAQSRSDVLLAGYSLRECRIVRGTVMVDIVRAQYGTRELLQQIILFVRGAVRADHADRIAALSVANLFEAIRHMINGLLPGDWNQFAVATNQRLRDAILRVSEVEGIAALDAEEVTVDAALIAIVAAHDLHASGRPAHTQSRLTAVAAVGADGADVVHLPGTCLVTISSRGKCADRADVDAHAALFALEMILLVRRNERGDAAILDAERPDIHAFAANAH